MFTHNKKLQYTVRVSEPNPALANLLLEQFGGPQGELAAAMRYFTQALSEDDPGRKDMLLDISTEELSHLEVIGSLVGMLNKGAKGRLAEAVEEEGELFRSLQGAGNDSHLTQVLYGGGPALVNSGGQLWNAGYIDSIGEPTADLRSNIAAEARAKIVYERLINVTTDPGVKEALTFLMTREMAHQKSFEKALYAIEPNFPPGKLAGMPEFQEAYVNTSQGEGDMRGPWNSDENFDYIDDPARFLAMGGGDGGAQVRLPQLQAKTVAAMAARGTSQPDANPVTGIELGKAEGTMARTVAVKEQADTARERSPAGGKGAGSKTGAKSAGKPGKAKR